MSPPPGRPHAYTGLPGSPRQPVLSSVAPDESGARRRSVILETITRVVFHTILAFSVFLLVSGHNSPGGGFVGGLTAGLAFTLRYVAGGRSELKSAVPVEPGVPLGLGLAVAAAFGVAGWFTGHPLESYILKFTLPVFGDVKLVTSLFFDVGVYLVVLGLVLAVLRTLGAEAEDAEGSISGRPAGPEDGS